jgi:hypothetical protein
MNVLVCGSFDSAGTNPAARRAGTLAGITLTCVGLAPALKNQGAVRSAEAERV